MASVISFLKYKSQIEQPVLILVGLHQTDFPSLEQSKLKYALDNCGALLRAARSVAASVAFVRRVPPPSSVSEPRSYPAWLMGFEPRRDDMVFDITQESCYSNTEFAQTMEDAGGGFTIAGLFGETICLSTAIDAYHRRHKFTYIFDASLCRNGEDIPDDMFHASVTQIVSRYGEAMTSLRWRESLPASRRAR